MRERNKPERLGKRKINGLWRLSRCEGQRSRKQKRHFLNIAARFTLSKTFLSSCCFPVQKSAVR